MPVFLKDTLLCVSVMLCYYKSLTIGPKFRQFGNAHEFMHLCKDLHYQICHELYYCNIFCVCADSVCRELATYGSARPRQT